MMLLCQMLIVFFISRGSVQFFFIPSISFFILSKFYLTSLGISIILYNTFNVLPPNSIFSALSGYGSKSPISLNTHVEKSGLVAL